SNGAFVINVEYGTYTSNAAGSESLIFRATGTESNYRGSTTLANGTLMGATNAPHGAPGALGNASSNVVIGTNSGDGPTTAGSNLALMIENGGVTIGRAITVNNSNIEALGTKVTLGG